ncbi:MAG: hypothetical protein FJZ01_19830 [Candidatus Sericytochromatia bacterium]|nr:hypothetical protein [Candidatus Tanganyikabacteria bacterium]
MAAVSMAGGYSANFGVPYAAGSKIPRLDASATADISAALAQNNANAMTGVMNQIMPSPPAIASPLAPKLAEFVNVTRARAEMRGMGVGFDHEATSGSVRFQSATSSETITTPGTTTTVTEEVAVGDALLAQGGKLRQTLDRMESGDSLSFEMRNGGQSAQITLDYDTLAASQNNQADIFSAALDSISQQLQAQGMDVTVSQRGGGNAVAFEAEAESGISVKGSQDALAKLGFVNSQGISQHEQVVTQEPPDLVVSGNTEYETITREVTTPGETTTKYFLDGGSFSVNGLSFNLEKTELQVAEDATAQDIQDAGNQAALAQIAAQFEAQAATNEAAGFQELEAPYLDGGEIVFETAAVGSNATVSFSGSGGTATATNGTDPSIDAGTMEINGVQVAIGAATFEVTSPDQDMTELLRQAAGHIRDAINAASGQTNVVAGVNEDNSLTLVSSLTGSRSIIKIGDVSSNAFGFTADTKAASLSAALQDLRDAGVIPGAQGGGGQSQSLDDLLGSVAQKIGSNSRAAENAQSTALDASAVLSLV